LVIIGFVDAKLLILIINKVQKLLHKAEKYSVCDSFTTLVNYSTNRIFRVIVLIFARKGLTLLLFETKTKK